MAGYKLEHKLTNAHGELYEMRGPGLGNYMSVTLGTRSNDYDAYSVAQALERAFQAGRQAKAAEILAALHEGRSTR